MKRRVIHRLLYAPILALLLCMAAPYAGAMSEEELQALYLGVVEQAIEAYEPLWRDYSDTIPNTGFFDITPYGNWKDDEYISAVTIPLNGQLLLCYSMLLNETDKETFSALNVPRATLREHAIKAIRWCCLTSGYLENPNIYPMPGVQNHHLSGPSWTRKHGSPVDVLGWYAVGVANLWGELDEETKNLVRQLVVGSAAKEARRYEWVYNSGGHHDRIKQDMASTIGAAFLFPDDKAAGPCREVVVQQCMDMVATRHDQARATVVDGRPVRDWYRAWHLYEDYASDHHAWAQIWYGCDLLFEGRTYLKLMSALTGRPPLEACGYPGNGFDGVLEWVKGITLPQGEPASVHGMEYDAYYGAGLLAYCHGAVINKDPVAASLEERAAKLLEQHINAVQVYDYHRNSRAKAAAAYLMHKYAGPRAEPVPFAEAWDALSGSCHVRGHQNLIYRGRDAWVSFAWDSRSRVGRGPQAYVVPVSLDTQEPLVYFMPQSIAGAVDILSTEGKHQRRDPATTYSTNADDTGFHTAGLARDEWLDRYCAFFNFGGGPSVLFEILQARKDCQLSWAGVPMAFYAREGITGPRTCHDAEGTLELGGAAEHTSNWWCVDNHMGLAIAGGNGRAKVERRHGYNWARHPSYRDKMDCVSVSPIRLVDLKAGELGADVVAAVYPSASPQQMSQAAGQLADSRLPLPHGWRGAWIPDPQVKGRRYLAVANLWGEDGVANLEVTSSEGAPVLSRKSMVSGSKTTLRIELGAQEPFADTADLYVTVRGAAGVEVEKLPRNRYRFAQVVGGPTHARVVYCTESPEDTAVSIGETELDCTAAGNTLSFTFPLVEETVLTINDPAKADYAPPFVEIREVNAAEDGSVTLAVDAGDQSGIAWVQLTCDGAVLGRKYRPPFTWQVRPGPGWHTFQAAACDASPSAQTRASFKRTVGAERH